MHDQLSSHHSGRFASQYDYPVGLGSETLRKTAIVSPNPQSPVWGVIVTASEKQNVEKLEIVMRGKHTLDATLIAPAVTDMPLQSLNKASPDDNLANPLNTDAWVRASVACRHFEKPGETRYTLLPPKGGYTNQFATEAVGVVEKLARGKLLTGDMALDAKIVGAVREALWDHPRVKTVQRLDEHLSRFSGFNMGAGTGF